jgi:hypothetical protein
MLSTTIFVIVGKNDKPIFELEMGETRKTGSENLNQFVIHSALDIVDETQWVNPSLHLKVVDQYKNLQVSCFVSPGYVKFMLLHNGKSEGSIKTFFEEVHEIYIKILMNPFYDPNTPIESTVFYDRAKSIMQRRLF